MLNLKPLLSEKVMIIVLVILTAIVYSTKKEEPPLHISLYQEDVKRSRKLFEYYCSGRKLIRFGEMKQFDKIKDVYSVFYNSQMKYLRQPTFEFLKNEDYVSFH